jgi:hypothetical protein
MVLSCCSSYMFSMRLDNASRCSFTCNVPEALFNVWSLSSGSGGPRFPRSLAALDELAKDQCQTDDLMIAVVTRALTAAGRAVKTLSKDGRFYEATLSPPRIVYPSYTVVHTHDSRVGILVCQKDAATLYRLADGTHNPGYESPTRTEGAPVHLSHWERHQDWRQSKKARPVSKILETDASRPRLEGLSESSFQDSVTDGEHRELQREGFDAVLGGEDPDCGHVTGAQQMGTSSVEHRRRLATFQDVCRG